MRFIAYWDRCKQHANIPIDEYAMNNGVLELYRDTALVGMFDVGAVDIWYISKGENT